MLSMKLDKDLKDRIDKYFEIVSAIDLYNILTQKYKFKSINEATVTYGLYLSEERTDSSFLCDVESYTYLDIKQELEVVKVKNVEDSVMNTHIMHDNECSIPFAA